MKKLFTCMTCGSDKLPGDIGLLLMRLVFGGFMAFAHGLPKLQNFEEKSENFMAFMGMSPALSLALAIFGELFCGILLMLGIGTRVVLIPLAFTMVVAAFIAHGGDPFGKKELALLFLTGYVSLFLTGPGRLSLDHVIGRKVGQAK